MNKDVEALAKIVASIQFDEIVDDAEGEWMRVLPFSQLLFDALKARGWRRVPEGSVAVPVEPTEEMLIAARDWSLKKYGISVGDDGAKGCYAAMIAAPKTGVANNEHE